MNTLRLQKPPSNEKSRMREDAPATSNELRNVRMCSTDWSHMVFFRFALLYRAHAMLPAIFFGFSSDSTGSNRTGIERALTLAIRCKGRVTANWMIRMPLMKLVWNGGERGSRIQRERLTFRPARLIFVSSPATQIKSSSPTYSSDRRTAGSNRS